MFPFSRRGETATKSSSVADNHEADHANSDSDSKRSRNNKRDKQSYSRRTRNTAQDALAYLGLTESGICVLDDRRYSITLKLGDINYQMASREHQEALLERYAQWINSFDASQSLQISVINRRVDRAALRRAVEMEYRGDGLDSYRAEYNDMIDWRLSEGRNDTVTEKYATITIDAENYESAHTRLMRLANESITFLRAVGGCKAEMVSGYGRVGILNSLLRPESRLEFDYSSMAVSGLTTKDVVAPWAIDFTDPNTVCLSSESDTYAQVLFLDRLPAWLSDQLIRDLTEINTNIAISLHARPFDPGEGLLHVNRRIADMEIQTANEQKRAAKQGYSADLVPHSLRRAHQEAVELRRQLEQSNEKLFSTTMLVMVQAPSKEELAHRVDRVREVGRRHSCEFVTTKWMNEDALNASLPLGRCDLPLFRTLTTASVAVLVPFTVQELLDEGGLYYGVNKLSRNLIIGSRQATMNGNAFYLGTSGAGKSMFGKSEIAQVLASRPDDDVIIIDPEREYVPLVEAFNGQRIEIHAGSTSAINPMELVDDQMDDNPVRRKSEFVLSMCEVLIGGQFGLNSAARSIIDRAASQLYNEFQSAKPRTREQPTLRSLFDALRAQPEPEAQQIATSLELYAQGSFSGFALPTNVDRDNRLTLFDISLLGQDMTTFGMLVVLEEVWSRVVRNRARGRVTWLYVDEFHVLFANEYAARYFQSVFKRARKYGLNPTGLTQNIEELLLNERARLMLANSDVLALLNQKETDARALQQLFGFSQQESSYFRNVSSGHGLFRMGTATIPFDSTIPETTDMYRLFTTKFQEQSRR